MYITTIQFLVLQILPQSRYPENFDQNSIKSQKCIESYYKSHCIEFVNGNIAKPCKSTRIHIKINKRKRNDENNAVLEKHNPGTYQGNKYSQRALGF